MFKLHVTVNYLASDKEFQHPDLFNLGALENVIADYLSDELATSFEFIVVPIKDKIT